MSWDEMTWTAIRIFDFAGAFLAGVLLWRKLKRQLYRGEIKKPNDTDIRFGLTAYLIGTSLLFGRAMVLGAPGGPHLLLPTIPLIWALRALIKGELQHRRDLMHHPTSD
jgi:hypothetical protein